MDTTPTANATDLFTLEEAAPLLDFKDGNSVRMAVHRGRLGAAKRGNVWFTTQAQIDAFLAARTTAPRSLQTAWKRTPSLA